MSILTRCKDACSKGATLAGVIVALIVGILAMFEGPRQFLMSYVGTHNQVLEYKNGIEGFAASDDGRGLYTCGFKDIVSILAFHLPLFVVCSCFSDLLSKFQAVQARNPVNIYQFRCHSTSTLILLSSLLCDVIVICKEGYWTPTPVWWSGLPQGHMPYFVKLYCLAQLAMLCYLLETVCFSGQNFATIRDEATRGTVNLAFCFVCYLLNFGTLMMMTFLGRFFQELILSFAQMISFMDMSGKVGRVVQFMCRAHRLLTLLELISYVILMLPTFIYGDRTVHERVFIITLFGALIASTTFRMKSDRTYELDGLQTGQGGLKASGQGSGDPASAARGKKSKSKSRK